MWCWLFHRNSWWYKVIYNHEGEPLHVQGNCPHCKTEWECDD